MQKPSRLLCYKKTSKDCWKTRNTADFHANSNPLEDISNPPCCDVTLLFRTFPKALDDLGKPKGKASV